MTKSVTIHLPDACRHDPRPEYIRALVRRAGLTYSKAAALLGVSERMIYYYVTDSAEHRPAPYLVQYALEALANA